MSKLEKAVVMDIPLKGIEGEDEWNRPMESADSEMEVLEASMARLGQLEDIIVRPLAAGRFGVISGHRRVAVARKLRWPSVRARVVEVDDDSVPVWGFATNFARKPIGIFWEAMEVRRLADKGMAPGDIGVALGHGENWVKRRLRLDLEACKRFKGILDAAGIAVEGVHASNWEMLSELTEGNWEWLAYQPKAHGAQKWAKMLAERGWLVRALSYAWVNVVGKPWAGNDGGQGLPKCEDCPHFGGQLAVLFPELEAVQSAKGCCSQLECVQLKRAAARAAAKKEIKKSGWKGKVVGDEKLGYAEMNNLKKCKQAQAEVAVVFGGDKSGSWGFYRKIKELPKEAEPGDFHSASMDKWNAANKAQEAFRKEMKQVLKAEIPRIVDGVELPERVVEALEAMRASLKTYDPDIWTYCQDVAVRREVNAFAKLVLFDVVFAELRATILDLERQADLEESEEDEEDSDDDAPAPADEATKGRDDEEDKGDKADGPRCKHCGEDGFCTNPANGGGFVCCHCAGFEPADGGEAVPF